MTDADYKELKTIAKEIVKNLNSCLTEQLKKHNFNFNKNAIVYRDILLKDYIARELIEPRAYDNYRITGIIRDYIRDLVD